MDYRLKTVTGESVRKLYQFFEWEALKYADEQGFTPSHEFTFGNSREWFDVMQNDADRISIFRRKNSKSIEGVKVYTTSTRTTRKAEDTETTETAKTTETTTTTETDTEMKSTTNNELQETLYKLTSLLRTEKPAEVDMDAVEKMIDEKIKNARTIEVRINDVPAFSTEQVLHDKFSDVLFWVSQNQPVYLFGPAGTGKNVLSEQVAQALGLPFYYAGCLQQKYELEGFVNAAGEYQETEFFRAFTQGGVFLFDEIDGTAAEVLIAFNAALANGYYNFPKYGRMIAHENFRVIAAGNTTGHGASDAYNGRFQLDASTLDRFAFIGLAYCKDIELQNAGGDSKLVEFAHVVRMQIAIQGLTYTFSTRAIKRIAMCKAAGIDIKKAISQSLCAGWALEDIKLLQSNVVDDGKNEYIKAFKNI